MKNHFELENQKAKTEIDKKQEKKERIVNWTKERQGKNNQNYFRE